MPRVETSLRDLEPLGRRCSARKVVNVGFTEHEHQLRPGLRIWVGRRWPDEGAPRPSIDHYRHKRQEERRVTNGVTNHKVALPYASSQYTFGVSAAIVPRKTSLVNAGLVCVPHVPVGAGRISATMRR
jgi:hypothetical protein